MKRNLVLLGLFSIGLFIYIIFLAIDISLKYVLYGNLWLVILDTIFFYLFLNALSKKYD